jgi:capsular polysaccharide biosynthesis protein
LVAVSIEAIGDFASGPIDGVEFQALATPDLALPEPPRFIFGPYPAELSATYYRLYGIGSVGIFRMHDVDLRGDFLLGRRGTFFRCPELNVHEAHIGLETARLSATGKTMLQKRLAGQYVVLAGPGTRVYGHWLVEYLPKIGLLNAAGYNIHELRYLLPTRAEPYVRAWLELFGIGEDRIVSYDSDLDIVVADELLLPTVMHNGTRASPLFEDSIGFLRGLIGLRHDLNGSTYGSRIFLSRSQASQSRALLNRETIEELAVREKFVVVQPEKLSLIDQVRLFHASRAIVGEYGSALHGAMFAPAGTAVCALRGTNLHPGFIQSGIGAVLHQPTGYVFGETTEPGQRFGFRIDEATFKLCVNLVFNRKLV